MTHDDVIPLAIKCKLCPGKPIENILTHLRRHIKCSTCNLRSCKLGDHCASKKRYPNEKILQCGKCDFVGEKIVNVRRHFLIHQEKTKFKCTECDFVSRQEQSLFRHKKLVHGERKTEEIKCPHCSYVTNRRDNLTRHIKARHNQHERHELCCEICGVKFTTSWALKSHKKIHTNGQNSLKCRFCDRKFNTDQARHTHENKFHGEDGFTKCSYCPRIFRNSADGENAMSRHIKGHVRKFDKCKFRCQNGDKSCRSNALSGCIFGSNSREELENHQKECLMRAEHTSVIAPNPHFKTLLRSVIVDKRSNPLHFFGNSLDGWTGGTAIEVEAERFCSDRNNLHYADMNLIQETDPNIQSSDDCLPDLLHATASFQMRQNEPFPEDSFLTVQNDDRISILEEPETNFHGPFIPGGYGYRYPVSDTSSQPIASIIESSDVHFDTSSSLRNSFNYPSGQLEMSWEDNSQFETSIREVEAIRDLEKALHPVDQTNIPIKSMQNRFFEIDRTEVQPIQYRPLPERPTADRVQVIVSKKPENSVIVSPPHIHQLLFNS